MSHKHAGVPANILTATTTEIKSLSGILNSITVNKDVLSSVITVYDNLIIGITADPNGIAETQTPSGAGNLTLDGALVSGGVATLGKSNVVTITSAGDDQARTFTVTGTGEGGAALTEDIAGVDSTIATGTKKFKTVTQIAVDAGTAGAVIAGNGIGSVVKIATITSPSTLLHNQRTLQYDVQFTRGLTVVTTTIADITVSYL